MNYECVLCIMLYFRKHKARTERYTDEGEWDFVECYKKFCNTNLQKVEGVKTCVSIKALSRLYMSLIFMTFLWTFLFAQAESV